MKTYVAAFIISFTISLILTPLIYRIAKRLIRLRPIQPHHHHKSETPRLGGVAVALSFFAPLVGFFIYENSVASLFLQDSKMVLGFFAGGSAILFLGCWDDIKHIPAKYKLTFQIVIASLIYACGFKISAVSIPFIESMHLGVLSYFITVLWIVGLINAINLIDGIDALASGVALFASFTLGVVSFINGHILTVLYCSALTGALLGFIRYNSYPAKIFLGDSGSMFLGFILAVISIQDSVKSSTAVVLLTPIIAFGIPFLDMIISIVRRYFRGLSFFDADQDHIHHRLLKMGFTPRKAVLILYGLCIVLNGLALYLVTSKNHYAGIVLVGITISAIFMLGYTGYLKPAFFKERFEEFALIKSLRRSRHSFNEVAEKVDFNPSFQFVWDFIIKVCKDLNVLVVKFQMEPRSGLYFNIKDREYVWKNKELTECENTIELTIPVFLNKLSFGHITFYWVKNDSLNDGIKLVNLENLVRNIEEIILKVENKSSKETQELIHS